MLLHVPLPLDQQGFGFAVVEVQVLTVDRTPVTVLELVQGLEQLQVHLGVVLLRMTDHYR